MKNYRIKSAGVFLLAAMMFTGLNAQSPRQGGRGLGPCGQGYGPEFGPNQGFRQYGQEFGQRQQRMAQNFSLDLSEEQQEEMQSLRSDHYKIIKPLRNKTVELKARERTLLSEENVDLKAVNKVIDEQTDLMNKIRKLQVEHNVNAKSILTDEQVIKLEQRRVFAKQRRAKGNNFNRSPYKGRPYHKNLG